MAEARSGRRSGSTVAVAGLCLCLCLFASGCDAPTRASRRSPIDAIDLAATIDTAGNATVVSTYRIHDGDVAHLRIDAPAGGAILAVDVDGSPARANATTTAIDVTGPASVVTTRLSGVVERSARGALVRFPVWRQTGQSARTDPLIRLTASITLPDSARPNLAERWFGVDGQRAHLADGVVRLTGRLLPGRNATVLMPTDSGSFGDVPVQQDPQAGSRRAERVFASVRHGDDQAFAEAADARRSQDLMAVSYWVLIALEISTPLLVALIGAVGAIRRRRRAAAGAERVLQEPPAAPGVDLAALVCDDGLDVGAEAVAATVLDLVRRDLVELQSTTSTAFRIRPTADAHPPGPRAEETVLAALGEVATAAPGGWAESPIALVRSGTWWQQYRRDVARRALDQGLVARRFPRGTFVVSVVALVVTSAPLWGVSPALAAGVLVVAMSLLALSALGGFRLTGAGLDARARWQAFGRHIDDNLELREASAPAIAVWGEHLVAAAALGIAKPAVKSLSVEPGRGERPTRPTAGALPVSLFVVLAVSAVLASFTATPRASASASTPAAGTSVTATAGTPSCAVGSKHDARARLIDPTGPRPDLTGADLRCQDLRGVSFGQTKMNGADLRSADLRDVDFGQAELVAAKFADADARGAGFGQAKAIGADFTGADLRGADFTQTTLDRAVLRNARAKGAHFGQAGMTSADLRGIDATAADFTQATLVRVDASDATFVRANLSQAEIGETDFSATDLADAGLDVSEASGSVFQRADLSGAKSVDTLRDAGADLTDAQGLPEHDVLPWLLAGGVVLVAAAALLAIVARSRSLARGE